MEQKNNNCKVNIEGSFRTVLRPQENNDKYTGGRYCEPKRDNLKPEDGNNEIDSFSKQVTHSTECDDFRVRIVAPMNSQSHVQDQEETSTSSSAAVLSIHPAIDKQVMSLPVTEIIQMNSTDDDSVSTLESLEKGQRSIFGNYWTSNDDISSGVESVHKASLTSQETASSTLSSFYDDGEHFQITGNRYQCDTIVYQEYSQCDTISFKKKSFYQYEDLIKENEEGRTFLPRAASLNDNVQVDCNQLQKSHSIKRSTSGTRRNLFSNKYPEQRTSIRSYGYISQSSSTSLLQTTRRQRPCLRTSQTMDSLSSCNSKLSVSFDPRVSVHEYDKRFEKYTHDGWSSLFY
jgi:hypothetical protein